MISTDKKNWTNSFGGINIKREDAFPQTLSLSQIIMASYHLWSLDMTY